MKRKDKRLYMLEEVIEYYRQHPRCMDYNEEGEYWFPRLSGTTIKTDTDGDVLGRFLDPSTRARLDKEYGEFSLEDMWENLPKDILKMGRKFLTNLSLLHDNCDFWDKRELSEEGKVFVEEIKIRYC